MRVIVYEHVSGGGFAGQTLMPNILAEGYGMLRCLVADFKAAGHEVTVLLDGRLSKLSPPIDADCVVPVFNQQEPEKVLVNIAKLNDAIYIIAPETSQTLERLVSLAEKSGVLSLNCNAAAIQKTADKAALYERLANDGFQVPETTVLSTSDSPEQIEAALSDLSFPLVFKPIDGVGCSGISMVKDASQIGLAVEKIKRQSSHIKFVAQQYVEGESASVCLLSDGKKANALSLNRQNVTLNEPAGESSYNSGCVPFEHPLKVDVLVLAQQVAESIRGLKGYVGIDLVLGEEEFFVVDVNPRLTTSYVGLREVTGFNVAQGLLDAVLLEKSIEETETNQFCCFEKIQTFMPTVATFKEAAELEGVVSPPFPLSGKLETCALVRGKGKSLEEARVGLEEAKKRLCNLLG